MSKEINIPAIDAMIALVGILKKDTDLPVARIRAALNAEIALLELKLMMTQHGGYDGNLPSADTSKFLVVLDSSGKPTTISYPTTEEEFIKIVNNLRWGTRGINGLLPLKWVRLIDCSSEHLTNILGTQPQCAGLYSDIIEAILRARKYI
jgi:hypothetical protein